MLLEEPFPKEQVLWEDGELDLLVLSGRMLANSANNNIPFLLKLPWDSAFASCIIEGESLCIEKQEVKLQSTQGVRCRVC